MNRNKQLLDQTGLKILKALPEDGQLTIAELGRQVSLTTPTVAERVASYKRLDSSTVDGKIAAVTKIVRFFRTLPSYSRRCIMRPFSKSKVFPVSLGVYNGKKSPGSRSNFRFDHPSP